jgi:hypothetical protein
LNFARAYGLLICEDASLGIEPIDLWRFEIDNVRRIIDFCKQGRSDPRKTFRTYGNQKFPMNWCEIEFTISMESPRAPPTLNFHCKNLLGAIQLQAFQSLAVGRKSSQCIECSHWFQAV